MRPVLALRHGALEDAEGLSPAEARLTDQARLAVVLEGAALLGHLERAGHCLEGGWERARVTAGGRLVGLASRGGADAVLPQRRAEELLLFLFRAEASIAGRGAARRAARELLEQWRQDVAPVAADQLIAQIVGVAPFLWQNLFSESRTSLAAQIDDGEDGLWVVGPRRFRRRLLRMGADLAALQSLLASDDAASFWGARNGARPAELAAAGRWQRALEAWDENPPREADERLARARALYAVGRFAAAKRALQGLRRDSARILRLSCQLRSGELAAAKRALVRWEAKPPKDELRLDLAAIASRLYASLGEPRAAEPWLERALASPSHRCRLRARLLVGEAAWDRGDLERVEAEVQATAEAVEDPDIGWRRRHLQGLLALAHGDGERAVRHLSHALGWRRNLRPFEAAGLWNDLALGRSFTGDLAGAERALRHVVRLTDGSEGDRRLTLALCNLAEVRLRRGERQGVRDVIERAAKANAQAGNWRGWAQDRELEVRYELVRGRPGAAIACAEETLERLAERGVEWRQGQLQVLQARAHGWLDDAAAAATALAATTPADRAELEPEERAPLLVLAGRRAEALDETPQGPVRDLWAALLDGPGDPDWGLLDTLEPYRAARLVLDIDAIVPGRVPEERMRQAAAALRWVGANALAERLEPGDPGPWLALDRYFSSPEPTGDALISLASAVSPELRLTWRDDSSEIELIAGVGGGEHLERPAHGGALRLTAPRVGPHERVLLALAERDLPASRLGTPRHRRRRHGMIGESRAMLEVLDRLSKLAASDMPILIQGETGTGKELAAQLVHDDSARGGALFLPVNCAALAENLLLSELFGHVKGAFTGADRDREGIFEVASGGTVLLDEIGDLPLLAQGKLLRVLQEGEVRRVGESVARPVDVRIVAATHRDLEAMVSEGEFRRDLFFRLSVGRVALPPLKDRGQDLLLLTEHFLAGLGNGMAPRLTEAARASLVAHSWPGNVRELSNVLTVAVALAGDGPIEAEHLDLPRAAEVAQSGYHERVEAFRRRLVQDAVNASGGNRAAAARQLGLSRQALSYLARQLDIV